MRSGSLIPGSTSSCELASTAHGLHGRDRVADVLGRQLAGEDDASVVTGCAGVMIRVGLLPGEVEHARDLLVAAEEDGVAAAVSVLALVELDEIGAGLGALADEDRDGEHRRRDGEDGVGSARALPREDEAGEIGARLGRCRDVLLAREPADLHERPGEQLAQLGPGIGRAHERRSHEHGGGSGKLGGRRLRAGLDPALRDHDPVSRRASHELQLRLPVDLRTSRDRAR